MSTATTHEAATENHEVEHHGLSDKQYIVIACLLYTSDAADDIL
jgi:hypothetical protein